MRVCSHIVFYALCLLYETVLFCYIMCLSIRTVHVFSLLLVHGICSLRATSPWTRALQGLQGLFVQGVLRHRQRHRQFVGAKDCPRGMHVGIFVVWCKHLRRDLHDLYQTGQAPHPGFGEADCPHEGRSELQDAVTRVRYTGNKGLK